MTNNPRIILKQGRDRSLRRRHPWVFSGAIQSIVGDPQSGDAVDVVSADNAFIARAAYSPNSKIRARVWTFDPEETIDAAFFERRINDCVERRELLIRDTADAYRVVFSESDGIPGLIADRYADTLVVQFLSSGAERYRKEILAAFNKSESFKTIYERSDVDVREFEGLAQTAGLIAGDDITDLITVEEYGVKYLVDVREGHKTGFYIDQRVNRRILGECAKGLNVLNVFSYTGGFGISALCGGAKSIVSIDSSEKSLEIGRKNVELNGLDPDKCEWVRGDAFETLRGYVTKNRKFDLIVLDPPKFASSREQLEKAERAYKDINLQAFKLLEPGGNLFTFSCSGHLNAEGFQRVVAWAALDAAVNASVVGRLTQSADHPVALAFPEAEYLKGLILQLH